MLSLKLSLAVLVSASLLPLVSDASPAYKMVLLPAGFSPSAINNAGQIAGNVQVGKTLHAFLFSKGKLTDLGTLAGSASRTLATALNEAGDVTGYSWTCAGVPHAFVYTRGRMFDIDKNGSVSFGLAINAKREVVGQFESAGSYHAFLFSNSKLKDLGVLGRGSFSLATGINDAGVIVGESDLDQSPVSPAHAFVYRYGMMKDLGHLDEPDRFSSAGAINNAGQIAGYAERSGGAEHLVLFSKDAIRDLGTFGGRYLTAAAINARGMIVGTSDQYVGAQTGFLYANGKLASLGTLIDPASGWTIVQATGINNRGQIVAVAQNVDTWRGVRLDPLRPLSHEGAGQDDEQATPMVEPGVGELPASTGTAIPEAQAAPDWFQAAEMDEKNPPSRVQCGGGGS